MKKTAFTLAEVLITLVIIGVVAALTIPNLMQKYTEQETVKKLQKFYSNLSNAYNLAMKDNGTIDEWGLTGLNTSSAQKIYEMLFKPYFKISKNCETTNTGNCISNVVYKLFNNGDSKSYGNERKYYKIVLEDGSAVFWRGISGESSSMYIFYDINGEKEPNQWGHDLFELFIINNKIFPSGIQSGEYSVEPFNSSCRKTKNGYGCAAWLIYKGNMDYLHCDLTWDKHSCKD